MKKILILSILLMTPVIAKRKIASESTISSAINSFAALMKCKENKEILNSQDTFVVCTRESISAELNDVFIKKISFWTQGITRYETPVQCEDKVFSLFPRSRDAENSVVLCTKLIGKGGESSIAVLYFIEESRSQKIKGIQFFNSLAK
jgi:hypothetical protein